MKSWYKTLKTHKESSSSLVHSFSFSSSCFLLPRKYGRYCINNKRSSTIIDSNIKFFSLYQVSVILLPALPSPLSQPRCSTLLPPQFHKGFSLRVDAQLIKPIQRLTRYNIVYHPSRESPGTTELIKPIQMLKGWMKGYWLFPNLRPPVTSLLKTVLDFKSWKCVSQSECSPAPKSLVNWKCATSMCLVLLLETKHTTPHHVHLALKLPNSIFAKLPSPANDWKILKAL